jgi:methylmalonyl-CoA/ethylmalonyl-CoA epimerase
MDIDLRIHHVGIVVPSIEQKRAFYTDVLGYRPCTEIIHDPVQTAFVQFFKIPGSEHCMELVAPDSQASKLASASRKGTPLNHLCYSCPGIEHALAVLRNSRCFVVIQPVPAVAFEGRLIAWLITPGRLLIELVEETPDRRLSF